MDFDDDVERIDLVDDFQTNTPARLKPIRTQVHGPSNQRLPLQLAGRVTSAQTYKPTEKHVRRQAEADAKMAPTLDERRRATPWRVRFSQVCDFHVVGTMWTDWYFTHNVPSENIGQEVGRGA